MRRINKNVTFEDLVKYIRQIEKELKSLEEDSYKRGYEDAIWRIVGYLQTGQK